MREKAQNEAQPTVFQLPRRSRAQHLAEHEADIERADVNQLALENILRSAQCATSHPAGLIAMSETSFGS